MPRELAIVPYRSSWPAEFQALAAPLRAALADLALRIDHIGSTAVPGLPAKDVIDIQVTVAALDREAIATALAGPGYTLLPRFNRDHAPAGQETLPVEEWSKLLFAPPPGQRDTNLHVRVEGRANQRYPLLFRDYLRANALAAGSYAEIKRQLIRYAPDNWDAYYDIKDPACDLIMAGAEEWAARTGWEPGQSDA